MADDHAKMLTLDFETYSEANVRLVGAHCYSRHPSTEVMILCYKINNGPIRTWLPHKRPKPPADLVAAAADEEFEFHAHNAEFESCIWREVMVRKHDAPPIALRRWRCTALKAAACGLPRSLEMAGRAAQLSQQKDTEGSRLIQKFCKPRKASKNNPSTRWRPEDAPEEFASFVRYCHDDVATEYELDSVLLEYPEPWEVYTQNLEMNYRGLPLDMPNVRKGLKIAAELDRRIVAKVMEITGGIKPTQRDKILEFMQTKLGLAIENTQAKTLTDLMTLHGDEMPAATREFLQLRIEGGKASPRKLKKMLEVVCEDGRVRGCFLPFGAHTGRESGKLIQPQNFKRGTYDAGMMEFVHSLIATGDADYFELLFHNPVEAVAEAMRGFIKAPKGRKMVVCDFAAIEARVLAWLAGDKKKTEAYRLGADLYKRMAVKLYKLASEDDVETWQRKFAKDVVLGCGFQLGGPGFAKNCLARGIAITDEDAQNAVDVYRDDSPEIVGFWKKINDACVMAVRDGVARINAVKCSTLRIYTRRTSDHHHWLCVRLPSGRELRYFRPEVKMVDKWGSGKLQPQLSYLGEFNGKPARESTYGGKLTENVVQAIARDIMIVSSFEAEKDGYPCIGRVHDELITEVDDDFGSKHELEDILKRRRKWYDTAPIGAEGFEGIRYRKA